MFELIADLKKLKELVAAKDFWAAGDLAWSLAKRVKDLIGDLSDSGLFRSGNEAELEVALQELSEAAVVKFGDAPADSDPKGIDPATVITLVTLVVQLVKRWRENRNR